MAASRIVQRRTPLQARLLVFWLASATAALLSVTAALVGLQSPRGHSGIDVDAAAEVAVRNQRIAFFEARATADPLDFFSLNNLSGEYLQRARESNDVGDYERAEYAAKRSLEIVPRDNLNALLAMGSVRLVQHDFAAAKILADEAIELKPGGPDGYGTSGDALLNLGRYDEAAVQYEKMVNIEASLPALSRLASLAFARGDMLNALDYWRQAIERAEGLPAENLAWAHSQRAGVYFATGDLKRAEADLRQSLMVYPNYAAALAGLGGVRAAQERWDEAVDLYSMAVSRQPQPQFVAALGDVYAAAGKNKEALEQYALVEAIDALYRAGGINTDLALARFYLDHEREPERALRMALEAYLQAPSLQAAGVYAWALFRNGDLTEAQAKANEALRLGTPDASLHYYAAKIADALGDKHAARQQIDRVLVLNPHFSALLAPDARKLQSELRNSK